MTKIIENKSYIFEKRIKSGFIKINLTIYGIKNNETIDPLKIELQINGINKSKIENIKNLIENEINIIIKKQE